MKKQYIRPYLQMEFFQIVAALAGSCADAGKQPINYGIDNCNLDDETNFGNPLFGGNCAYNTTIEGDMGDGVCYHAFDANSAYLSS